MTRKRIRSDEAQSQRFIEAAQALGCEESEERFNEVLKKVARHKPIAGDKPPPKQKTTSK